MSLNRRCTTARWEFHCGRITNWVPDLGLRGTADESFALGQSASVRPSFSNAMESFFVCSSVWGMLRVKTTLPFAFTTLALPSGRMSSLQSVTNNTPVLRVPAVRYKVRTGKGNPWISVSWGYPSLSIHVKCRSELLNATLRHEGVNNCMWQMSLTRLSILQSCQYRLQLQKLRVLEISSVGT